ncbi:hypothetical protein [Mycobacterium marinum]|uniref:hypothetical protein n=1 Tax=Mycobacterium marinum TaxID=1781 RepID=UPI002358EFE4|nr:hypothetical protein [Mycobacterium marinum]MDC8985580.1 hypothetical protein [Mycobacterium marinum]
MAFHGQVAFHGQFVQATAAGAGPMTVLGPANTSPSAAALDIVNEPFQALLGRPLIGDGANGRRGNRVGPVVC